MKKALSVFLMTALAFGAFAQDAEPVADVNIAEFSGNAAVQWGVDLDTGTTGFKNSYEVNLKLNLLNNGTKSTTGDGVWGELVLKTDDDTFIGWTNGGDRDEMGDKLISANNGMVHEKGDEALALKVFVDTAKIHIGPAYIGIKRGDTQTGELKMDAAIRSADDDQSKWLENVGPDKYNHGIVLGMDTDVVKVDLDLRSYGIAADPEDEGIYNVENNQQKIAYQYTDAYAAALEAELKGDGIGVEGLSVKGGVSFNFAEKFYSGPNADGDYAEWKEDLPDTDVRMLGYSASMGYKLGLDDTFYVRPQVGFTGQTQFYKDEDTKTSRTKTDKLAIAAGLLFGWGEIGMDQDAGVYYLDDDHAKKVSPGVGVVAYIPLPEKTTTDTDGNKTSHKAYKELIRIMPSFYSGELIPGLTAAAYADIGVTKLAKDDTEGPDTVEYIREEAKVPMAFALGAQYAIPVGEMTITPKLGVRFANAAYVAYSTDRDPVTDGVQSTFTEKEDGVFNDMGVQQELAPTAEDRTKYGLEHDGNFMNLKLGVDVGGLIDNTTLSVIWETKNILNDTSYGDGVGDVARFGPKLGTLNFKAKIAL